MTFQHPMVEGILAVCYGMKWCGETPTKITILPEMMRWFYVSMYDHKRCEPQEAQEPAEEMIVREMRLGRR